jgi:hypothetical protein
VFPKSPPRARVIWTKSTSNEVIGLVFEHLKDGWKRYIVDDASYRGFNNLRGQWAMCRHYRNRAFAECNFLCQVVKVEHSAKSYFAECRTQQRYTLGKEGKAKHSAKALFAECQALGKP